MRGKFDDLTGKTFERWTVLHRGLSPRPSQVFWLCRCICGTEHTVAAGNLRSGCSVSCGCFQREDARARNIKHGMRCTTMYNRWRGLLSRCLNPNEPCYHRYGGRGIKVCRAWQKSFEAFYRDMGEPPVGAQLDRRNNDKGYNKKNCRWVTASENSRNRQNAKIVTYNGTTRPLIEWCEKLLLNYDVVARRLWKGWTASRAFETPIRQTKRRKNKR